MDAEHENLVSQVSYVSMEILRTPAGTENVAVTDFPDVIDDVAPLVGDASKRRLVPSGFPSEGVDFVVRVADVPETQGERCNVFPFDSLKRPDAMRWPLLGGFRLPFAERLWSVDDNQVLGWLASPVQAFGAPTQLVVHTEEAPRLRARATSI